MAKKYALCIGINDYPGTESDLSGCVNDANDWSNTFKKYGFSVEEILNKQATKKTMVAAFKKIVSLAADGDLIAIQYSGHGTYIPDADKDEDDGTDECLCPHDITTAGPISDDELSTIFSSRKAGVRIVMFSDSCHSGSVTKFAPIVTPPTSKGNKPPQRKVRFLPPSTFLKQKDINKLGTTRTFRKMSPPGRHESLLMSGCQDVEYSYDAFFNDRPNGAFTYVALETLKSLKPGSTYAQWHKAIIKVLPSQQYPQRPNLYGTKGMKQWKILA